MNSFEKKIKERNNLLKSQVESLTGRNEVVEIIDTLLKAGVAEEDIVEKAKYIRREADGKGGYKYIYSEPKENKIKTDNLEAKINKFDEVDDSLDDNTQESSNKKDKNLKVAAKFIANKTGAKKEDVLEFMFSGKGKMGQVVKDAFNHFKKSSESDIQKAKETKKQQKKIKKVMDEWKSGSLTDSHGNKIESKTQALAVALSEAGLSKKKD